MKLEELPATTKEHWEGKKVPAKSVKQRRFMGMVHAAQKGEKAASPEVAKVAREMDPESVLEFAETEEEGLPMKKKLKKEGYNKKLRKESDSQGKDMRRMG